MALTEFALAELVDNVCAGIRAKVELEAGDSDNGKYQKLLRTLKAHDRRGDGKLAFEEFTDALVRLNVVGPQNALKALFMRYDLEGEGLVECERMAARVSRTASDGESNTKLRTSLAVIRRAAAKLGLYGINILFQAWDALDVEGKGVITRNNVGEGARNVGIELRESDLLYVYGEYDPLKTNKIKLEDLKSGVRGILTRRRRIIVDRAWSLFPGDGSSTTYDAVIAHLRFRVPSWFGDANFVTHLALTFRHEKILLEDFITLHKDFNAVLSNDDEFNALMADAWGVDSYVEPSDLVLPGSVESIILRQTLSQTRSK